MSYRAKANQQIDAHEIRGAPATAGALISSPPLSASNRTLVRWCLARYGLYWDVAGQETVEKKAEQAARSFFGSMSRAEIARRLVPIRKALYRGTRAYTAVAFVLAYYDIDFEHNARRVVESISLIEPPARLKATGFKNQEEDPSGAEEVAYAVATLYRRHHSQALLSAYLQPPTDGHLAEGQDEAVNSLFLAYPAEVLRAAEAPQDLKRLAECVYDDMGNEAPPQGHGDNQVERIIHRLEQSHNLQTARLARRFQRVFASQEATAGR